jgi:hypothetical protein
MQGTVSDYRFVTKFSNFEINFFKIFEALALVKAKQFLKNLAKSRKLQ